MLVAGGGICALLLQLARADGRTFTVSLRRADATTGDLPLRWWVIGAGVCTVALIAVTARSSSRRRSWHSRCWRFALSVPLGLGGVARARRNQLGTDQHDGQLDAGGVRRSSRQAICARAWCRAASPGAVAAESEGLMQDFRAGAMIGSTPAHPHLYAAASPCRSAPSRSP